MVDDSEHMRKVLRGVLERAGHEVMEAASGEVALAEHEAQRPDLVTLDLVMPGLGGLETLRRMRARHPETRVVVVTAAGTREDANSAYALGARTIVQKPFDEPAVRGAVEDALR